MLRRLGDLEQGLPARRDQPVFVAHGWADQVVPARASRELVAFLEGKGYRPAFRSYPAGLGVRALAVVTLRREGGEPVEGLVRAR